jgi:peptidoglycan/xylan/chitin deacetylase (PgdA/CDA1 family)
LIGALLGAGASAAGVLHAGPALAPIVPGLGPALGVEMRHGEEDGVALTFDDGPHPQGTPAVLEILRERGATATFFLAGEQVARRPALVAEIVAAGHGVELHCHRHRNLLRLSPRAFLEDAERAREAIEDAGGRAISDYRPTGSSAPRPCAPCGDAAGDRFSGHAGDATGTAARPPSRSPVAQAPASPPAT